MNFRITITHSKDINADIAKVYNRLFDIFPEMKKGHYNLTVEYHKNERQVNSKPTKGGIGGDQGDAAKTD